MHFRKMRGDATVFSTASGMEGAWRKQNIQLCRYGFMRRHT
jgi:hypothetical protein